MISNMVAENLISKQLCNLQYVPIAISRRRTTRTLLVFTVVGIHVKSILNVCVPIDVIRLRYYGVGESKVAENLMSNNHATFPPIELISVFLLEYH